MAASTVALISSAVRWAIASDVSVVWRVAMAVPPGFVGPTGTVTSLASGKRIPAETVMYSAGRQGQTDGLDLPAAGLTADNRGRIAVDANFATPVEHIYAVGDVIGFPALASTSMEQGRLAVQYAFGTCRLPPSDVSSVLPYGIYTIPDRKSVV